MNVEIFDSTLRDGAQAEGISFLVGDKIKIAKALDDLGVDFIEAGNPGSNKKDLEFFKQASKIKFNHSKLVAFGSTRRCNILAEADCNYLKVIETGGCKYPIDVIANEFSIEASKMLLITGGNLYRIVSKE